MNKKQPMIQMKDMQEDDWRGIIAIIYLVGTIVLTIIAAWLDRIAYAAWSWPLLPIVLQWYFKSKESPTGETH